MKKIFILLSILPLIAFGQTNNKSLADSLKFITTMPYMSEGWDCGDKIFWKVVYQKQSIIPFLVEKLTDTTTTQAYIPNFGGHWTVADIAFTAIEEIIDGIPTFELLGVPFDTHGCGYCAYWNHLRKNVSNRKKFQQALQNWLAQNQKNLTWVESDEFLTCDCTGKHPNAGHFELKK